MSARSDFKYGREVFMVFMAVARTLVKGAKGCLGEHHFLEFLGKNLHEKHVFQ
jgi:hypothetical protein